MKTLLILWAIGLAGCDKLDRTYLPPQGSGSAGGYPEDLNLPLEYPIENFSSTSKPESVRIVDSSLSSKYPNIALGIDRQGPIVTSSPTFTDTPKLFVTQDIYNIPSSTTSFSLSDKSTIFPAESYGRTDGPVATSSQGYSFPSTSFHPELSYDQYLNQQNIIKNKAPETIPNLFPQDPVSNIKAANLNTQQLNNNYEGSQLTDIGTPEFQSQNVGRIPSNLAPSASLKSKYPMSQYEGDLDSISEGILPYANESYFDTNSTPRVPISNDNVNANPTEFNNSATTGVISTSMPGQTFGGKLVTITPSPKYTSTPLFSNNFNARNFPNIQPQRKQAEGDRNAVIINYENTLTPEGFAYSFDTSNGIHADESGTATNGVKAKGSYSFVGDDGKTYSIEYTADENGFIPRGDHLPTAPPIPNDILRGIEQAEKDKMLGIIDDGSYDDAKYGHQRYQGLMYRNPQMKYNNILNEPNIDENEQGDDEKTTSFGSKLSEYSVKNNNGITDENSASNPNVSQTSDEYQKGSYVMNNIEDPKTNRLFNSEANNFNGPKNKIVEDVIDSIFKLDKEIDPNDAKISGVLNPIDNDNIASKEYNALKDYDSGYEYSRPQNIYNGKDQNNLNFNIPSLSNDDTNLIAEGRNDRITAQDFTIPNASYNVKKINSATTSPLLTGSLNDPLTIAKNNFVIKPTFNNIGSSQIDNKEREFSALEPKITTTKPYYYQSPSTSDVNGIQSNKYPSSTLGSQYSVSTTPLPSQRFSSSTPPINNFSYSTSSPTTSQVSSTLRPSITSGQSSRVTSRPSSNSGTTLEEDYRNPTAKPTSLGQRIIGTTSQVSPTLRPSIISGPSSRVTSRPSSYSGKTLDEDYRNPTVRPTIFGQRIIGRPGYQGIQAALPESQPGFVGPTDSRSENFRVSSRPTNFSKPSSVEKIIGEDFNGPKQSQKFDPQYGYYY